VIVFQTAKSLTADGEVGKDCKGAGYIISLTLLPVTMKDGTTAQAGQEPAGCNQLNLSLF
jgi:hypothetical protein